MAPGITQIGGGQEITSRPQGRGRHHPGVDHVGEVTRRHRQDADPVQAIEDALQVESGTLRRVAAGENVDPEDVRETTANGQVLTQLTRLADQVQALRRRIEKLESRDE